MKAALLSNATSRFNRRHLPEIRRRLDAHGAIRHVETQHPSEIEPALCSLAASGTRVLGINGGDGTTHLVLSALMNGRAFAETPTLAILPGGTTNMTARDLNGAPLDFFDALESFVGNGASRPVARRHVLRTRAPGAVDRYGFCFGMGAIVRGIEFCHERVYRMGIRDEWASGVAMLRAFWGIVRREPVFAESVPLELNIDERHLSADASFFLVTSLDSLFLGIKPFWGTGTAPLNATLVRSNPHRFLRTLPALLRGRASARLNDAGGYSSWRATSIGIEGTGTYTIDGEMYATNATLAVDAVGPMAILALGSRRGG